MNTDDMHKTIHQKILGFIGNFKGSEDVFLNGCCYWFAKILYERFELEADYGVDIMYEPVEGHFLAKIEHHFYDIRGDVTEQYKDKQMYDLHMVMRNDLKMYRRLMRDCRDFVRPADEDLEVPV